MALVHQVTQLLDFLLFTHIGSLACRLEVSDTLTLTEDVFSALV